VVLSLPINFALVLASEAVLLSSRLVGLLTMPMKKAQQKPCQKGLRKNVSKTTEGAIIAILGWKLIKTNLY
jgi:hypothetical protein